MYEYHNGVSNFKKELKEYQRVQDLVKNKEEDITATEVKNSATANSRSEDTEETPNCETLPADK